MQPHKHRQSIILQHHKPLQLNPAEPLRSIGQRLCLAAHTHRLGLQGGAVGMIKLQKYRVKTIKRHKLSGE